jgi:hypothetical protein
MIFPDVTEDSPRKSRMCVNPGAQASLARYTAQLRKSGSSRKSVMAFHDENVGEPIWATVCAS